MSPWEFAGKALVVAAMTIAFTLWQARPDNPRAIAIPLALFAFAAVFSFCLALYELIGRGLGMAGELLFNRTQSPPATNEQVVAAPE